MKPICKFLSQQTEIVLLKMREIVHIQVGQCGNQIGSKVST